MLNKIFKLFPFFIVEWLAKHYCEVVKVDGLVGYAVFDNVLVLKK